MSRRYFILGTSSAYGNKVGKKDCEHHFSSIETKSPIGSSMDFAPQRILKILEILLWPLLGLLLVASRLAIANPVGKSSKQIFFYIIIFYTQSCGRRYFLYHQYLMNKNNQCNGRHFLCIRWKSDMSRLSNQYDTTRHDIRHDTTPYDTTPYDTTPKDTKLYTTGL